MPELREALENAIQESETAAATSAAHETPAVETPAASSAVSGEGDAGSSATVEGEAGTGKAAEPDATKPASEASSAATKPAETKPQTPEEKENARLHRIDRAPQSWKKEAKGEWAALPLHIRQEVHKREAEINRVLAQAAPDRQIAEHFKATVQPFMAAVQARGIDPVTATRNLFEADHKLSNGHPRDRAAYMAQLIVEYGISVEDLDSALAPLMRGGGGQPQQQSAAPDIQALIQQQLQQALGPIMQERQQAQQRATQEVEQTVENMTLDPKYPFFDEVRMDMADLIDLAAKRGVALSLDEAYSRAVRANPDTFGQLERQSTVSAATQAHQAAMRAKAAGSSVSGAPAGGGGQFNGGDGSLRGAIEAAFGGQRL